MKSAIAIVNECMMHLCMYVYLCFYSCRLKLKGTKGEQTMLKFYAAKYFKEINTLLGQMPSDMLLLLKTNDCLRHLDTKLGTPVNTTLVVANTVADVLLREDLYTWWNSGSGKLAKESVVSNNGEVASVSNSNDTAGSLTTIDNAVTSTQQQHQQQQQLRLVTILSSYASIMMRVAGLTMLSSAMQSIGGWWR